MTALSIERNLPSCIIALHVDVSEVFQDKINSPTKSVGRKLSFGLEISKFVVAHHHLVMVMFQWWDKDHEERQFSALLLDI